MSRRIAFATFIGGFIAWAFVSITWFFVPVPCMLSKKFKNEEELGRVLIQNSYFDGIYVLPNLCENVQSDPPLFVFSVLKRSGVQASSAIRYVYSLIIQFVGAYLLAMVMHLIRDQSYWKRIISGFLLSVVAALVTIFIPDGIWWKFPIDFLLYVGSNLILAWFLTSIAIALVTAKPTPPKEKEEAP